MKAKSVSGILVIPEEKACKDEESKEGSFRRLEDSKTRRLATLTAQLLIGKAF
jgi:hypothetical protein